MVKHFQLAFQTNIAEYSLEKDRLELDYLVNTSIVFFFLFFEGEGQIVNQQIVNQKYFACARNCLEALSDQIDLDKLNQNQCQFLWYF